MNFGIPFQSWNAYRSTVSVVRFFTNDLGLLYKSDHKFATPKSENRSFKYGFRSTRGIFKENAV